MLNRRRWMTTAAALTTAAIATTTRGADAPLPIVDTHQHLWDLEKFRIPWLGEGTQFSRSFVTKDYLEAAAGLNITKAVYMEVDVAEDQKELEAEHYIELAKQKDQPTVAAVVGCRPASPEFAAFVRKYRDQPVIKGFRQVTQADKFNEPFIKNLQLLGELDKSFDLCVGGNDVPHLPKIVDQCPDTRFILDHCGNPDLLAFLPAKRRGDHKAAHDVDDWRRAIEQLAKRERVICKISGIIAGVPKEWSSDDLAPIINHCLDSFGPKRVVFGSDWPICLKAATLKQWVTALKEVIKPRPIAEQKQLLAENAMKWYRLG